MESPNIHPYDLCIDDLIEYLGTTYRVGGQLDLTEDGYDWREFWLDSPNSKIWMSVERNPNLEIIEWTKIEVEGLTPGAKTLVYGDATYRLNEKGVASYSSNGSTGLPPKGRVKYFDYVSEEPRELANWLSFERFDRGAWEVATGMALYEGVYRIHRPSSPSAHS